MISLARKNLFAEKLRLAISVGGVAFSTFLILILLGIYAGTKVQITRYINKIQADLWVMEEGVTDMFHSFSFLPDDLKGRIERKTGGGQVYRLIARATQLTAHPETAYTTKRQREKFGKEDEGLKATISLIGYDTTTGIGGPWKIKIGKPAPGKKEIIIDEMLSRNKHIVLGDQVEILNELLTVVGISTETNLIVEQMVFMDFSEAQDLFNFRGNVNYYLVTLPDPRNRFEVKDRINDEIAGVSAKTRAEFAQTNGEIVNESFVPIIATIVAIGFLVGTVVVGLTIYTATLEKLREYGILKALGASNLTLYKVVLEQSLWTTILGFGVGSLLTLTVTPVIQRFIVLNIIFEPFTFAETLLVTIGMGVFAAYIPIRKIAGVDPLMVFKT